MILIIESVQNWLMTRRFQIFQKVMIMTEISENCSVMLTTSHSGFTLLNFEGDVNGITTVLSMTKGKEVRIVGRIPISIKKNDTLNNVEFCCMDNDDWLKTSRSITVLTNLNEMIIDRGIGVIARMIIQLTKSTTVIGVIYGEMTSPSIFNQLTVISSRVGFIDERDGRIITRVRTVKKNGLVEEKKYIVNRGSNGGLIEEIEKVEKIEEKKEEIVEVKRSETKGKSGLEMPFEAAKSQDGLVSIHHGKVRVGGRIIYSADDGDDLDDSDPDDDLHI
ncbi:hypothetical protein PRIPAC_87634 [Pristionchus pacificus]|uniref:Elongator complex protein 5 n=1 Tax=Pristionchus pacificus TaxID=54126 RepID=A0A2A6D3Y5_PRIPA|nr:hypothetical protein PRIPAC_87634 [Pristionchus pacificus]|eukprot:PDM84921.1 hypothetical protein PRIPAC_36355 [Pristionchus pacificus]